MRIEVVGSVRARGRWEGIVNVDGDDSNYIDVVVLMLVSIAMMNMMVSKDCYEGVDGGEY